MGHWSELPSELLVTIEELLGLFIDKVQIRAVCTSWNSLLPKMPNHQVRQLPWLLRAFDKNTKESHGFFDLSEKKFCQFNLPELQGKLFVGSSHGWILTVQDVPIVGAEDTPPIRSINSDTADMYVINPLTGVQIRLPPRYTFPDVEEFVADRDEEYCILYYDGSTYYINSEHVNINLMQKVVMSTTPLSEDCVVVAIYGEFSKLAWCKCNDEKWTYLNVRSEGDFPAALGGLPPAFDDVIFYKGKLYALNCKGEIIVFEDICVNPKATKLLPQTPNLPRRNMIMYLVEGSDEGLLLVMRYVGYIGVGVDDSKIRSDKDLTGVESIGTLRVMVFKLDSINLSWVEVKNIGDDILFLGSNSSFSVSSRDFLGYKGNCIYFTDSFKATVRRDEHATSTDICVFNLEDGSFESLPGFECEVKLLSPPPIWITRPSY